jgi:hypothetical protein
MELACLVDLIERPDFFAGDDAKKSGFQVKSRREHCDTLLASQSRRGKFP